jgi:hypothetical protein
VRRVPAAGEAKIGHNPRAEVLFMEPSAPGSIGAMTRRLQTLAFVLALGLGPNLVPAVAPPAAAQTVIVSVNDFEPALSPYGRWFAHPSYGRIWQPYGIGPGWRPYTAGYWTYLDDDTWLWVADEPWGWAAYHYGRWLWLDGLGWVWRPGMVWAPAWVVWRFGGGYCGWAPAPFDDDDGWRRPGHYGGWGRHVPPGHWTFVRSPAFLNRNVGRVAVPPFSNERLLAETEDVTRVGRPRPEWHRGREDDNVAIQGPPARAIGRETGRPVIPTRIVDAPRPGPTVQRGDAVQLFRPDRGGRPDNTRPRDQLAPDASGRLPPSMQPLPGRDANGRPLGRQEQNAPQGQGRGQQPQEIAPPAAEVLPGAAAPPRIWRSQPPPQAERVVPGVQPPYQGGDGVVPAAPAGRRDNTNAQDRTRPNWQQPAWQQPARQQPDLRQPDAQSQGGWQNRQRVEQPRTVAPNGGSFPPQVRQPQPQMNQPQMRQPEAIQPPVMRQPPMQRQVPMEAQVPMQRGAPPPMAAPVQRQMPMQAPPQQTAPPPRQAPPQQQQRRDNPGGGGPPGMPGQMPQRQG